MRHNIETRKSVRFFQIALYLVISTFVWNMTDQFLFNFLSRLYSRLFEDVRKSKSISTWQCPTGFDKHCIVKLTNIVFDLYFQLDPGLCKYLIMLEGHKMSWNPIFEEESQGTRTAKFTVDNNKTVLKLQSLKLSTCRPKVKIQ